MQDTLRAKFLGQFVETAQVRVAAANNAVREDSAKTATHELHALAGECSMLGFDDMGTKAREAEALAKAWEGGDASARVKCGRAIRLLQRDVQALVAESAAPAPASEEAPMPPSNGKRRVLIVDDSEIVADQLQELLEGNAISSRVATTLEDASRQVAEFEPAIALLDLNMPGVATEELVRRIRAASTNTKILLVSGVTDEELATSNAELGTDGYVSKQGGVANVIDSVTKHLVSIAG